MCSTGALICRRLLLSLTVLEAFLSQVNEVQALGVPSGLVRSQLSGLDPCMKFSEPDEERMEFYSPMHPNNYPNNTECILTLKADYGYAIKIDFRDYFHLEPSEKCEFDFLEVRDGAHGYSDMLGKYCGNEFPKQITSKDQNLWLRFTSDDTIEYKGFRAVYEYVENTAIDRPKIEECRFFMSGIQGLITHENITEERLAYSRRHKHPIDCTWVIEVKEDEKVYLFFKDFKLHEPNECDVNYVDVFDENTDLRNRMKHYCGSVADPINTKSKLLYFRYFSRHSAIESKFEAYFTAYREISKKDDENPESCRADEYDCDDETCIDATLECNGIKNCRHEYDEEKCEDETKGKFNISDEHIVIILTLGCALLGGMCFAMCFNCIRKLIRDGRQIHENIRRSREQLEERRHPTTMSAASSPRVVYRPTISEDGPCFISDAKTNGHPCIKPESESETDGDEDDDEEVDDMEESCVEMRDCECQTRDSLLTQRDSGQTHLPMTPPPPPPPNRRPPGLPPLSPGLPPAVPTPPPPPGSHYGRAPAGPPSDHYGSYGRPPVPRHNDPYEVDDQSDDSYAQRYRAEAVIEMRDKGHYEPTKSPKTTPDVLATH